MSNATARATWNALIRTHHITSRKKVTKLRQAASSEDVFALLRSGGAPGIMYVEGQKVGVENWVAAVQVRLPCSIDVAVVLHPWWTLVNDTYRPIPEVAV